MKKPVIAINVTPRQFKALALLLQRIIDNMTGNVNFLFPSPTLLILQTALTDLQDALAQWGQKGNRGSHEDYVNLKVKAYYAHTLLMQEADYCMSVVDPNTSFESQTLILQSSGFTLKNPSSPQGVLAMVQNFRRLNSIFINADQIKLKWKKPLNVITRGNVRNYNVYRNTVNNFDTAKIIASVPPTTYTDTPGTGSFYYWVIATNTKGNGVTSNVVTFSYTPLI